MKIETARLQIRPPVADDFNEVHDAILESLPALQQFPLSLPWAWPMPTEEGTRGFCSPQLPYEEPNADMPFLLFRQGDKRFIGSVGLHRICWGTRTFEVGFWLRTSETGKGYCAEGVHAISSWAQASCRALRFEAFPDLLNASSRKVLEASGFKLEKVVYHDKQDQRGTVRDTCVYAKGSQGMTHPKCS